MPESLQVEEVTATVGTMRVVFALLATERSERRAVAQARTMYRGVDVFLRHNSATDAAPTIEHVRARDAVDFNTGAFKFYARESAARNVSAFRALLSSRAEFGF
jgi:hypothetical protein